MHRCAYSDGETPPFISEGHTYGDAETPRGIDLADLRRAIRETRKVGIAYSDVQGQESKRIVWPIAIAYYVDVTVLGAWCELRRDFRHFRVERIITSSILDNQFPTNGGKLMERWFALQGRQTPAA